MDIVRKGDNDMTDDVGRNESRTLKGGEIVYLVKDPGAKWRIRSYECRQGVAAGGRIFVSPKGLPHEWEAREFETADEAEEFAQQEIQDGKVPANRQSNQ